MKVCVCVCVCVCVLKGHIAAWAMDTLHEKFYKGDFDSRYRKDIKLWIKIISQKQANYKIEKKEKEYGERNKNYVGKIHIKKDDVIRSHIHLFIEFFKFYLILEYNWLTMLY